MKLCSGLLLSVEVIGQSDRWAGSYDYVDTFNYGGKRLKFKLEGYLTQTSNTISYRLNFIVHNYWVWDFYKPRLN